MSNIMNVNTMKNMTKKMMIKIYESEKHHGLRNMRRGRRSKYEQ